MTVDGKRSEITARPPETPKPGCHLSSFATHSTKKLSKASTVLIRTRQISHYTSHPRRITISACVRQTSMWLARDSYSWVGTNTIWPQVVLRPATRRPAWVVAVLGRNVGVLGRTTGFQKQNPTFGAQNTGCSTKTANSFHGFYRAS